MTSHSKTDDAQHEAAHSVLDAIGDNPDAFGVPDVFYSELIDVLSRRSGADTGFVESSLTALLTLGLRALPLTEHAIRRAGQLACDGLSGYHATFAAIAEDLQARWLTADHCAATHTPSATTLEDWSQR